MKQLIRCRSRVNQLLCNVQSRNLQLVPRKQCQPIKVICTSRYLSTAQQTEVLTSKISGEERKSDQKSRNGFHFWLPVSLIVAGVIWKTQKKILKAEEQAEEDKQFYNEVAAVNKHSSSGDEKITLADAIQLSREKLQRRMVECGCPGLVIAVSVDGKTVWKEGMGYSDVENNLQCKPETIFRIASISKSITMAVVAKLWENGDLDLDKPVNEYLPEFPQKTWEGKKVDITVRHLVSHLAGIRHYDKSYINKNSDQKNSVVDEMKLEEYYIQKHYNSVTDSLKLFQDDPLVHKPDSQFLYTSHGWTLVSAVVEKAAGKTFEKYLTQTLDELGMTNTYLEYNAPIIPNRGRHYVRNARGKLENAPYVDLSYKWAGGGLISNVLDLVKFGNIMLSCYFNQSGNENVSRGDNENLTVRGKWEKGSNFSNNAKKNNPPTGGRNVSENVNKKSGNDMKNTYLKGETVVDMWKKADKTKCGWGGFTGGGYGLGWGVWPPANQHICCKSRPLFVSHTGGAIGASSVLLIVPSTWAKTVAGDRVQSEHGQNGVVVAIIVNMMSVELNKIAFDIAELFGNIS